jgi:cephalosporin hydroxylase
VGPSSELPLQDVAAAAASGRGRGSQDGRPAGRSALLRYGQQTMGERERDEVVRRFAEMWWSDRSIFFGQTWLGIPTLQHPFDAWVTQEIIVETRPERIVEAGALCGGSATMWAMILDNLVPDGRVIAIDLHDGMQKARTVSVFNRRVDFVRGSTVDPAIVRRSARWSMATARWSSSTRRTTRHTWPQN